VGEYDVLGNRPVVGIDLWAAKRHPLRPPGPPRRRRQRPECSASIDLKRLVKAHVSYQRFLAPTTTVSAT
jgi:hypothetical protein